jgi:uncharacterized damage-inducible protein DinB
MNGNFARRTGVSLFTPWIAPPLASAGRRGLDSARMGRVPHAPPHAMKASLHSFSSPTMLIDDFRAQYANYRQLAEKALAQMPDAELNRVIAPEGNSAAMLVRHVSGNFVSRFTNFLTEDGEKPDRERDREFDERPYSRAEVNELWARGFAVVDDALAPLADADLERTVTIRQQPMTVHAALTRSLAHLAYHVGQIVLLARIHAAGPWDSLSIPRGQSQSYDPASSGGKKAS